MTDASAKDRSHLLADYLVVVREVPAKEGGNPVEFNFECKAENFAHAQEQAENAYPDAQIVSVENLPADHPRRIIRIPSADGPPWDLYVSVREGSDIDKDAEAINEIIKSVNSEEVVSGDGACRDGNSVEQNIRRRLQILGFEFFEVSGDDKVLFWDEGWARDEDDAQPSDAMKG